MCKKLSSEKCYNLLQKILDSKNYAEASDAVFYASVYGEVF